MEGEVHFFWLGSSIVLENLVPTTTTTTTHTGTTATTTFATCERCDLWYNVEMLYKARKSARDEKII